MNGKRLLLLAVFGAIATFAAPAAFASSTANQANVNVNWNAQAISSMVLTTNYSATGAQQLTAPTIFAQVAGSGACQTATLPSETAGNVDFSNVTPDSAANIDCLYKNGINAAVSTTDSLGYSVTELTTAQTLNGATYAGAGANHVFVCLLGNGSASGAFANNGAATQSSRTAAPATTAPGTCGSATTNGAGASSSAFPVNTTSTTLFSTASSTTGTNLGSDVELILGPSVNSGVDQVVVQYTLTVN